jgi:hypothetical protein
MKSNRLPAALCHANCTKCGLPTEFRMFESGPGGDFSTFVGQRTSNVYRVNLGQIHYLGKSLDQLLLLAIEYEGGAENLAAIPEQIKCKVCGAMFSAERCMVDGEEIIDAFEL